MATTAPTTKPSGIEVVWLEDDLPAGATKVGNWKFVTAPDSPVFSGKASHTEAEPFPGPIQHLFTGGKFAVSPVSESKRTVGYGGGDQTFVSGICRPIDLPQFLGSGWVVEI